MLHTEHWGFLSQQPSLSAKFKTFPEDFIVREQLGYEPCGEGEHIYLWIRKSGLNTAFVAEQLAKFCRLPLRAVTYAGRKDKHALTEQWFGIHKPGKTEYDWSALNLPGAEVLQAIRHNKKLRTGVLKSNRFTITLREISDKQHKQSASNVQNQISERIEQIKLSGVPNYFGPQRFGDSRHHQQGGNLALAEKMLNGESIRNRNKRSMAISALRSWLFNEFVSERLARGLLQKPLCGDVMMLSGSNSFFTLDEIDQDILSRLQQRDLLLSAPMWGQGPLSSHSEGLSFETQVADKHHDVCQLLASLGLKQERRAIMLYPESLTYTISEDSLSIDFELPAGAFATSVLREIIKLLPAQEEAHENTAQ